MNHLLYLKKGQEDPAPFTLFEYEEQAGGRLHGPSTLQKLQLASLEVQQPGTADYVPVAFHTGTELSLDKFQANTREAPLLVTGKGVESGGGAGGSQAAADLAELRDRLDKLQVGAEILEDIVDWDETNVTVVSVPEFKDHLIDTYSKRLQGHVGSLAYCMLTYKYLPRKLVIGAHLWKCAWAGWSHHVGIPDINTVRNGLLLCKPLEWAFDNSRLSIVPDTSSTPPIFQAYLQDFSLQPVLLTSKLQELRSQGKVQATDEEVAYMEEQLGDLTFGHIHGRCLKSDCPKSEPHPLSRVLQCQYKRALRKAAKHGWLRAPGPNPSCHSSPGAWNVERLFASVEDT